MTEPERSSSDQPVQLNDNLIRLIGIPFFGLTIPHISGLLKDVGVRDPLYWVSHLYFVFLAAAIWQGNRFLLFRTRQRFTWFEKPVEKLVLLVVNNIFYTAPLTVGLLVLWYNGMNLLVDWSVIRIVCLINVICVLFVTHIYETVFLLKEQQLEQFRNLELQRAKAEAELIALKNQVDPHFMFNSLNTLSHLIQTQPALAYKFTDDLSDVYRYILSQKDRSLVLLEDELEFTHKYTDLLQLRFGNALVIRKEFGDQLEKDFLIPPNSVFMAFENAVKHNEISEEHPMNIRVNMTDNRLIISNSVRRRRNMPSTFQIGLKNLDERFRLLTGKEIIYTNTDQTFAVSMPLIPVAN